MNQRANYSHLNTPAVVALASMGKHIDIDPRLRAIVELRISQINGCAYCVDMHCTQAREHGETQQRLDCVAAWRECSFFHRCGMRRV